jgi:hypothetical protein
MVGIAPRRNGPDSGRARSGPPPPVGRRGEQLSPARRDVLAHGREPDVARVALDELNAQERLELLDPRREGGLRDELRLRRGAEVQALGELDEVRELAQGGQGGHRRFLQACNRETRSL